MLMSQILQRKMVNFNLGEFIRSIFEESKQKNRCENSANCLNANEKFLFFYCEGVVHAFANISIQRELRFKKHVELRITSPPIEAVKSIEVHPNGRLISIITDYDIIVIQVPQDLLSTCSNFDALESEYLCRTIFIGQSIFSRNRSLLVQKIQWFSVGEDSVLLIALTSDGVIRIFNIDEPEAPVFTVTLDDTYGADTILHGSLRFGLEDKVVSFAIGNPIESRGRRLFPLLLLSSNGDVHQTLLDSKHFRNYQIVGPLTMLPLDDEENYVMDARMLLYLPSDPPVLVIGTNNGRLYHCVLLMTNRDNVDQELHPDSVADCTLYVCEIVKLEFIDSNGDDKNTINDLRKDSLRSDQYYCISNAGIHAITLNWVAKLADVEDLMIGTISTQFTSSVSHIVSTRLLDNKSSIICGHTVLESPHRFLALIGDGRIVTIPVDLIGYNDRELASSLNTDVDSTSKRRDFLQHINSILQRSTNLPVIKQRGVVDPKEAEKIIATAGGILRIEYIEKLMKAANDCESRAKILNELKRHQEKQMRLFKSQIGTLEAKNHDLLHRITLLHLRQDDINEKFDQILRHLRTETPTLSHVERDMLDNLRRMQKEVAEMKAEMDSITSNCDLNQLQTGETSSNPIISKTQRKDLEDMLKRQAERIESLVGNVKSLNV